MTSDLQTKVRQSIRLLQQVQDNQLFQDSPIELAYSGGKDSDVILHLARTSGLNVQPIYKNTTIDPPGTIIHAFSAGAIVRQPKRTFFQIMEAKGYPSRFARFCCSELKEYKITDTVIMGVRKAESIKRDKIYSEPIECRKYKSGKVQAIYPILYWTDENVREYIEAEKIKLAPVYYDEAGSIHCERRLGCLCCPLQSKKKRIEEFKNYPGMVKAYLQHGQVYFDNHPNVKTVRDIPDAAHYFILNVFCENLEEYRKIVDGNTDVKQYLSDYFKIDLT